MSVGGGGGGGWVGLGPEVELTTERALYGFYGSTVTNTTKEASQQNTQRGYNVAATPRRCSDVVTTL